MEEAFISKLPQRVPFGVHGIWFDKEYLDQPWISVLKCAKRLNKNSKVWSFKSGDTKLERFLPKTQHTQRKLFNF